MARRFMQDGPGLLDGISVVDVSIWRPAPYATQLLADLGAEVWKVEAPDGDPMRMFPSLFGELDVGKRHLSADLKVPVDRARVLDLAADADVFVEGFRPGVADRLGVGWDAVSGRNPRIVYCSVSGFGQDGPLADAPAHDLAFQAWAGTLRSGSRPPIHPPVPLADVGSGVFAAFAICAALTRVCRSGEGERIDVSMADILATWGAPSAGGELADADDPGRSFPAYGLFETADGGYVALAVATEDHFWQPLCAILGLGELARLDGHSRRDRADELHATLAARIQERRRDDLVSELLGADVPAAPAHARDEVVDVAHFVEHGTVASGADGRTLIGHPVRFLRHPARRAADGRDTQQGH